jgi:hypothetical protein
MYVLCQVRLSSTYKNLKQPPKEAVEAYMYVSCEVRTSTTYKKVKLSP